MQHYTTNKFNNGKKKYRPVFVLTLFFLIIFSILINNLAIPFLKYQKIKNSPLLSPAVEGPVVLPVYPTPQINQYPKLAQAITDVLSDTTGKYGIVVKSLTGNEYYSQNELRIYESASLYKLWVMAVVFQQIQQGRLFPDDVISKDISDLNDKFLIDPENAELTEGAITLTVGQALKQMITISHNYSALLLADKIGLSQIQKFLNENGLNQSSVGRNGEAPTTTAYDTALFLEKLYNGDFAEKKYTEEMLSLLKTQQINTKLPKYLPDNVIIAHKTGELGEYDHDAGIVYTSKGNYIIVVMSDTNNPAAAKDRIAKISQAVYKYFTR